MSRYTVNVALIEAKSATGAGMFYQRAELAKIQFSITCPSEYSSTVESCLRLLKDFPHFVASEKQSMGHSPTKCRLTTECPVDMHAFSILDADLRSLATLIRVYEERATGENKEIAGALLSKVDEALLVRQTNSLTI